MFICTERNWKGGKRHEFIEGEKSSIIWWSLTEKAMTMVFKLLRFFCLVALMAAVAMDATRTPPSQQQAEIGPVAGLFNIRPLSIFTGHCNASVARGATVWKSVPGVVDVFFPKVVSEAHPTLYSITIFLPLLRLPTKFNQIEIRELLVSQNSLFRRASSILLLLLLSFLLNLLEQTDEDDSFLSLTRLLSDLPSLRLFYRIPIHSFSSFLTPLFRPENPLQSLPLTTINRRRRRETDSCSLSHLIFFTIF